MDRLRQKLDNREIPSFIYGTAWKEDKTEHLVLEALDAGFRGIDTANQRKHYHEAAVGDALDRAFDEGTVSRDELFVQTKYTYPVGQDERMPYDPDAPFTKQVADSFQNSLEHLGLESVYSYILHGPQTRRGLTDADREVWDAIEGLYEDGKTECIGVSNISPGQLDALLEQADSAPDFVQNRCFARTEWDAGVRSICDSNDIVYQGFSLLTANRRELSAESVRKIAGRHDKTIPQIAFRFATQIGILPLTGTTSREHMEQDLQIFDFELTDDELDTILHIAAR